jgi:hypothetical protein
MMTQNLTTLGDAVPWILCYCQTLGDGVKGKSWEWPAKKARCAHVTQGWTMNMNMNNLYTILKGLDEEDVAYTVSVNGGPSLPVIVHSTEGICLVRDNGNLIWHNSHAIMTVEIAQ